MKSGKARLLLVGLAAVILGSTCAGAQNARIRRTQAFGPSRPPMEKALGAQGAEGRWWNNPRMVEQLKLTDDQRKAMDQIFYDHRTKLIDLQANLQKAELSMQELMGANQLDQKAMVAQIDKIVSARGELERANARFLLDIRMKLTPDQWKQLRESRGAGMAGPAPGAGPQQWRDRRNEPKGNGPDSDTPPANGPAGPGQGPGTGLEQ